MMQYLRDHRLSSLKPKAGMNRIRFAKICLAACWPLAPAASLLTPSAALGAPSATFQMPPGPGATEDPAVVVYLVRHAEKADDGTDDPPLALHGQIRVQTLLALLADVDLTHVHTTDLKRTRDTARPFAQRAQLEANIYDPRGLESLATDIIAAPGRHFVSGHSNTTPALVAALGGDPSDPIDEMEYDRLYIVVIQPGQPPLTTLLRFGEPYVEGADFGLRAGGSPVAAGIKREDPGNPL